MRAACAPHAACRSATASRRNYFAAFAAARALGVCRPRRLRQHTVKKAGFNPKDSRGAEYGANAEKGGQKGCWQWQAEESASRQGAEATRHVQVRAMRAGIWQQRQRGQAGERDFPAQAAAGEQLIAALPLP